MDEELADALLAERFETPTVPEYTQRDRDRAEMDQANSATYEQALLRKKRKPLP